MIDKKTWKDFQSTGLLLFINSILHVFGWAIVIVEDDEGETITAFPARVKFRGFDEKSNAEAYVKISEYLSKNANQLEEESKL